MTFPILASLLVRLVVLLPFQLLRLSLATTSRWPPLALSVFLHCVVFFFFKLKTAYDIYAALQADKNIQVVNSNPLGFQYMCRFNHLHPPFNNQKVRQAALAAMAEDAFLRAQVGIKEFYRTCPSMFTCGTPYGSAKGSEIQSKSNMRKAQEL